MHVEQVLALIINNLSANKHKVMFSWSAIQLWQQAAFDALLANKIIIPKPTATAIQCHGCEYRCNVDVVRHEYPNNTRYYAVCEHPVMHEQMGRLIVLTEQMKQWEVSIKQLAIIISDLLNLSNTVSYKRDQKSITLGTLKSKSAGRKSVVLNVEPLSLLVNQSQLPIKELLYFENNKLALDKEKIDHALNLKQSSPVKAYRPNTDKNEQNKANTQAMYQDWQDEYEKLKRKHPNKANQPKKTKGWYAYQISKMPIAQGGSVANITRVLKN